VLGCRAIGDHHRRVAGASGGAWHEDEPGSPCQISRQAGPDAKKKTPRAAEQSREDVAEARQSWLGWQRGLNPGKLVFVDETWTSTNMAPRYGWGPKGERVDGIAPHGHWKTSTFVAALRHDRITAPCVFDGPINGASFKAWTEQALAPTLEPGDIVILDNLGSHKVAGVKQAIEARGAKIVYLPPYSPDLNPIEQVFAKLKHLLRKTSARTVDALHDAIASLLDAFSPVECRNYITNSGYSN